MHISLLKFWINYRYRCTKHSAKTSKLKDNDLNNNTENYFHAQLNKAFQ
ncbi:hypothetical protein A8V23_06530 [Yersinia pestis]|uniref:Uncharacterized protein n=1 Tax=Yersinia pestis PY-08 TaxID=992134 RepID=A0AB72ZRC4_YERPE|nr:hypothetical protein YPC_0069 [Yersinia pestis biovar Medievalis str. Harbin 35]AEL71568.1 hypothetical protein A1122_04475 [Yersinia pestis A1122]ANW16125.1 hypothetical protein BAY22_20300 [Yersinia pestis]EEO74852.1 hypothetical protein YP516_4462 [Yersinia pestis Nepal516]EEO82434.1 hypothetical protein YPF_0401 [Yersinia pestis biovar Orientalis str. India 195]EEO86402.1 hypothetical protein YPH_2318 [Yersinia pestis biovar Orientalis str. PEXU2]EEO92461.1 hypothetical protein YPS_027